MRKPSEKDIQRVTAYLGSLGGKAGTGASKRNATTLTPETAKALAAARDPKAMKRNVDYAALARKAAKARKRNRKAAAAAMPVVRFRRHRTRKDGFCSACRGLCRAGALSDTP